MAKAKNFANSNLISGFGPVEIVRLLPMKLAQYQDHLGRLGFGKRLPAAIYVHPDAASKALCQAHPITAQLARIPERLHTGPRYNVVKFRETELKVSSLSYPDTFEVPHSSLWRALTVDLVKGKSRVTGYSQQFNPPILNDEDAVLPPKHSQRKTYAALSRVEEQANHLDETTTIGFRMKLGRVLADRDVKITGHRLE